MAERPAAVVHRLHTYWEHCGLVIKLYRLVEKTLLHTTNLLVSDSSMFDDSKILSAPSGFGSELAQAIVSKK